MSDCTVIPYDRALAPAVAEIERLCFPAPWSETALALLYEGQNGGFVAVRDGSVVGYVGYLGVLDELEITNVAVHPSHRRQGIGEALLHALMRHAHRVGAVRVTLDVRVSNVPAIALYEKFGFAPCGIRKNFYSVPREDAIVMEWKEAQEVAF